MIQGIQSTMPFRAGLQAKTFQRVGQHTINNLAEAAFHSEEPAAKIARELPKEITQRYTSPFAPAGNPDFIKQTPYFPPFVPISNHKIYI